MSNLDLINSNADNILRRGQVDLHITHDLLVRYLEETDGVATPESTAVLARHMIAYAKVMSPIYGAIPVPPLRSVLTDIPKLPVFSKDILNNKSLWYIDGVDFMETQTSGSSGPSFKYRLPLRLYRLLEGRWHYGRVLTEFDIMEPRILHVTNPISLSYQPKGILSICNRGEGPLWDYGNITSHVMAVAYPGDCYKNRDGYCRAVLELMKETACNVLATTGGFIATLAEYVSTHGTHGARIQLLSSTAQPTISHHVDRLLASGLVTHFCDHMRCWDGGASFLTCKFGSIHLLEDLSYVHVVDGRLVSIDYFNLTAPFVNYWNGDYCTLEGPSSCACGRSGRTLRMDRVRDFVLTGKSGTKLSSPELEQIIWLLPEGSSAVQLDPGSIGVKVPPGTSQDDYARVTAALADFDVQFMLAEPRRVSLVERQKMITGTYITGQPIIVDAAPRSYDG